MMRYALTIGLLALGLTGCGNMPAGSGEQSDPVTTGSPAAGIGQVVKNRGATIVVKSARIAPDIEMNESNFQPGSGYETYTKTSPAQGGKFVVVDTHVRNDARQSMDLTCSLPINTKVVDDRGRQFDSIQDLYKLRGNPECNDQLQPGFEDDMTYVYLVPQDAKINEWQFTEMTDSFGSDSYTSVRLGL